MTKPAFKKGQAVTVIGNWDHNGTVYIREATVHSCGKKVLRLTCNDLKTEFGRELRPNVAESGEFGVRPALTAEEAAEEARKCGEKFVQWKRERIAESKERNGLIGGASYLAALDKELARIHEVQVKRYHELSQLIADAINRRKETQS